MKPFLVFILLLPALCLSETARIATWNLGGLNRISDHKLENIIEGLKILGDYNMVPVEDQDNFDVLQENHPFSFVSDNLGGTHISTSGGAHISRLLDGYGFLLTQDGVEYQNGSIAKILMHEEFEFTLQEYVDNVTDHLPVLGVFETSIDHD